MYLVILNTCNPNNGFNIAENIAFMHILWPYCVNESHYFSSLSVSPATLDKSPTEFQNWHCTDIVLWICCSLVVFRFWPWEINFAGVQIVEVKPAISTDGIWTLRPQDISAPQFFGRQWETSGWHHWRWSPQFLKILIVWSEVSRTLRPQKYETLWPQVYARH